MFHPTLQGLYCMSELLRVANEAPEMAVRMHFENGEMSLGPDQPAEGDRCFEFKGKTVLIVSQELVGELDGRVLDAEPNPKTGQMDIFFPLSTRPESRKRRVRDVGFYEGNHA